MDEQTGSDFLAGRFMMPNIATESSGSCRVIRRVAMGGVALKERAILGRALAAAAFILQNFAEGIIGIQN